MGPTARRGRFWRRTVTTRQRSSDASCRGGSAEALSTGHPRQRFERGPKRLDGERGGVAFACGQSADGARDVVARESRGIFKTHAFEQNCERGAAGERRRAAVCEEARGRDAIALGSGREFPTVAADRGRLG